MTSNTRSILSGIGVSAGTASGPVAVVRAAPGVDVDEPPTTDAAAVGSRVAEAAQAVVANLKARAESASPKAAAILEATAQLAGDRGLLKAINKELAKGTGAT